MEITISYSDLRLYIGREQWEEVISKVLEKAAELHNISASAEMSVLLCDNDYIRRLNRDYRNVDNATDVLSFALNEGSEFSDEESDVLGDIVISVDKVEEQAKEYNHSAKRELAYLSVHGFLHIIGYDHMTEEEKKEMRNAEEKILRALQIGRED